MYSLVQKLIFLVVLFVSNVPMHYATTLEYPSSHNNRNVQLNPKRRQGSAGVPLSDPGDPSQKHADRFKTPRTSTLVRRRTAPYREEYMEEQCDYLAQYCLKSYQTGRICARTIYFNYQTFKNYCMMDYVNCRERYEVWQILHMGHCYDPKDITDHIHYEYDGDSFLDADIMEEKDNWSMQVNG